MRPLFFILLFATFSSQSTAGSLNKEWVDCVGGTKEYIISWSPYWSSNSINLYLVPEGSDPGYDVDDWNFELGNLGSGGCTTASYASAQFAMFVVSGSSEHREAYVNVPATLCGGPPP
jgi:hypothetical protein